MAKAKAKPKAEAPPQPKGGLGWIILVALVVYLVRSGGGLPNVLPPNVIAPTTQATAVVYVYEKDQHAIPAPVSAALDKINREKKINATQLDVDVKDGTGDVPEQYKIPFAEAVKAGLPALVVMNGSSVVKVVKSPTTEQAVLEAVP